MKTKKSHEGSEVENGLLHGLSVPNLQSHSHTGPTRGRALFSPTSIHLRGNGLGKRSNNVFEGPLIRRHVGERVGEDFEMIEEPKSQHLDNILDEPPEDAINPDPQRQELVLAEREAHDRQPIESALGPEGGEDAGDDERSGNGSQQRLSRLHSPEEALLGAA